MVAALNLKMNHKNYTGGVKRIQCFQQRCNHSLRVPSHGTDSTFTNQNVVSYGRYHISTRNSTMIGQRLIYKFDNLLHVMEPLHLNCESRAIYAPNLTEPSPTDVFTSYRKFKNEKHLNWQHWCEFITKVHIVIQMIKVHKY